MKLPDMLAHSKFSCLLFVFVCHFSLVSSLDILIRNTRVIDPSSHFDRDGLDVGIAGSQIALLEATSLTHTARVVIDGKRFVVCPGFINLGARQYSEEYERSLIENGVTTTVDLAGGETNIAQWLAKQNKQGSATHFGTSISLTKLTSANTKHMGLHLRREVKDGGVGVSVPAGAGGVGGGVLMAQVTEAVSVASAVGIPVCVSSAAKLSDAKPILDLLSNSDTTVVIFSTNSAASDSIREYAHQAKVPVTIVRTPKQGEISNLASELSAHRDIFAAFDDPRTFTKLLESQPKSGVSLLNTLSRITSLPADLMKPHIAGFHRKGKVQVGVDADIVILESMPKDLASNSAGGEKFRIREVIVGGEFVMRGGHVIEGFVPGVALRGSAGSKFENHHEL